MPALNKPRPEGRGKRVIFFKIDSRLIRGSKGIKEMGFGPTPLYPTLKNLIKRGIAVIIHVSKSIHFFGQEYKILDKPGYHRSYKLLLS